MGDFFLYRWQCNDAGEWLDSKTIYSDDPLTKPLPPIEQHRREWCQCILCRPDRYPTQKNS